MVNLKNFDPLTEEELNTHLNTIKMLVSSYLQKTKLPPDKNRLDLEQELYFALLEAIRTFSYDKKISLKSWICRICNFRLLDFSRKNSWVPKETYHKLTDNNELVPKLYASGDLSTGYDEETNTWLPVAVDKEVYFNQFETNDLALKFFSKFQNERFGIRNCKIFYNYFYLKRTYAHIAKEMKLTESRICQIINEYLPEIKILAKRYLINI